MLTRKAAILVKMESTYGGGGVPGPADAILLNGEPDLTPMDMQTVDRNLLRAFFGNSEKIPTGLFTRVAFSCELAGSGTAGTAPAWGKLMRMCAFSETITAATKVEYKPVTDALESGVIYVNRDGVLHQLTGARGSVKLSFAVDGLPKLEFNFLGLFNPVTDDAMPTVDFAAWKKPLPVNADNTPTFSLHGYAAAMDTLSIDVANQVSRFAFLNETESIEMTDRMPAGSIAMKAVRVADKDWWTAIKNVDLGILQLIHGKTAGNKVQVDAPKVQIHNPRYADKNKTLLLNAELVFAPNTGNDELVITCL